MNQSAAHLKHFDAAILTTVRRLRRVFFFGLYFFPVDVFAHEISEDKHYLLIKFQHSHDYGIISEPEWSGAGFM